MYTKIIDFGCQNKNSPSVNPLSYCAVSSLENSFNNTLGYTLNDSSNQQCQRFMSNYCANNWDGICEYLSNDSYRMTPGTITTIDGYPGASIGPGLGNNLTKGQLLIRNTALEKYMIAMSANCTRQYEPFDPTTADSPLIYNWVASSNICSPTNVPETLKDPNQKPKCIPVYGVDPNTIDSDIVMNKILDEPWIAIDVLVNIYNNAKNMNTLEKLRNTRIYKFFMTKEFQQIAKEGLFY